MYVDKVLEWWGKSVHDFSDGVVERRECDIKTNITIFEGEGGNK